MTDLKTNYRALPLADLMQLMGQQLRAAVKKNHKISEFSYICGVPPRTLTRLFRGEDVGWEVVIRVLRHLERWDILYQLLMPPQPTPMERLQQETRAAPQKKQKQPQNDVEEALPYQNYVTGADQES